MAVLAVRLEQRVPNLFSRYVDDQAKWLLRQEAAARTAGAAAANTVTRQSFRHLRPADASKRVGRHSTKGQMTSFLNWRVKTDEYNRIVYFDTNAADRAARHWIIQEIGTGQRAMLRAGGAGYRRGRFGTGNSLVRTIKSQRGRPVSRYLAFGTGPSGVYSPPGATRGQQLYLRSRLTGVPLRGASANKGDQIIIGREIKGQHFVKKGGTAGFRVYRNEVLAAARQAFAGFPYRP